MEGIVILNAGSAVEHRRREFIRLIDDWIAQNKTQQTSLDEDLNRLAIAQRQKRILEDELVHLGKLRAAATDHGETRGQEVKG
jgi:hypothetical protein